MHLCCGNNAPDYGVFFRTVLLYEESSSYVFKAFKANSCSIATVLSISGNSGGGLIQYNVG